jgi:hypothetical protein
MLIVAISLLMGGCQTSTEDARTETVDVMSAQDIDGAIDEVIVGDDFVEIGAMV